MLGYTTRNSGVPATFKNYFVVEFDHPFVQAPISSDKTQQLPQEGRSLMNLPGGRVGAAAMLDAVFTVSGQEYSRSWLSHAELLKRATLDFEMSAPPHRARGMGVGDAPFSVSKAKGNRFCAD